MNCIQFKDEMAVEGQIELLLKAARIFGVPLIKKIVSETEAFYSVAYTHRGEEKTLVLKLSGDDNALMVSCLTIAKRSQS